MSQESCIKDLDLRYLEKRLTDKLGWSAEEAKEAVRRYKNFLILFLRHPSQVLAPAPDIDEAWHHHILFTREYTRDCQAIFGGYLHHSPSSNSDPEEKLFMEEAQSRTSDLYVQEFDEPFFRELNIASLW